jgi:hypothetical protein
MRKKIGVTFGALAILILVAANSYGGDKKTSVLGFNFESGAETFAETFTSELRGAVEARVYLGHTGKSQDLEQLALAFGCPETPDPACLKDIGDGLDSTHLIYGVVKKASKEPPYSFQVETHLFVVASGKIEKSTSLLIPADKQGTVYLQEGADRIVAELFSEPPSTTIIVQSNVPGAVIMLDEEDMGQTGSEPLWLRNISPGKHRIIVKKEGYKIFEKKIDIKKGTRVDVDAPLLRADEVGGTGDLTPIDGGKKKSQKWRLWTGVALTVVGVGLAGGGVAFTVMTNSKNSDLEEARSHVTSSSDVCDCFKNNNTPGDCLNYTPDEDYRTKVIDICDQKTQLHAGQIALYSAGAVVGGVGLYFLIDYLVNRREKKDEVSSNMPSFSLVPSLTPTGGGLSLSTSF